jgi:conjugal transfer pilus assembly protein TraE
VTPETINSDNELVLSHTSPQYYAKFKSELQDEEAQIKSQKVSSAFYMSNIKADPENLEVNISGKLKRWVGERPLSDSHKEYKLRFLLNGNELFLTTFQEVDKNKEA